ncbi:MAG: VOC family protein, partial [Chthonomonadales bacterium]
MPLSIRNMKPYVPAKDFEESKRFYTELGFRYSEGWGGTADFELNGHSFRLQNYYVEDWANNFMLLFDVDDVDAWYRRIRHILNTGIFPTARVKPPEPVDGSSVLH